MDYAIIRLGGKQYRVREGEYLVVDRLKVDEGKTFNPDILLGASGVTVTAKVLEHGRGPKIRIGKYRPKNGYKRHTGFRAATSQVVIESIGSSRSRKPASWRASFERISSRMPPPALPPCAPPARPSDPGSWPGMQEPFRPPPGGV